MSDAVFNLIDREKLLSGEDYDGGQVSAPPGAEPTPMGLTLDAQVGRFLVFVPLRPR